MKTHSRRMMTLGVAICAAGAMALTSCSSDQQSGGETDALEVLSWWTSASEQPALDVLLDGFSAEHEGVNVTNSSVAGGSGSNAQVVLTSRLASGNPPDVWQTLSGGNVEAWVRAASIADVSALYTPEVTDALPDAVVDSMSVDGKQYGVPTGAHRANVLLANTAVLDELGITLPTDDTTLDEFLADIEKVSAAGATPMCLGGKDSFTVAGLFESVLLAHVGQDGWDRISNDRFNWSGDDVQAALADFGTIVDTVDPQSWSMTWDQAATSLAEGDCAFEQMNDSAYAELRAAYPDDAEDIIAVAFPGTSDTFLAVIDTFVQAKGTVNSANATAFQEAILDPTVQSDFSVVKGSIPVRLDADVSELDDEQLESVDAFRKLPILQSISYGELVSPAFQQGFFDAVDSFANSRDASSFAEILVDRVTGDRPGPAG